MTDTLSAPAPVTSASSGVPVTAPVTAVVVTAGLTRYLPTTLAALANQTRKPVRVLLVDVGGPPGVPELLDRTFRDAPGPTPRLARTAATGVPSFGRAVSAGLEILAAALGEEPTPWLWLLHDDSAPAPTALAELVRAVGAAPSVAIAGSKQRTWTDPERLLEVGVRTTRWGRRMTDVEPGELDQGQLDGRTDVLAVGLAGALVRRDVWDALRGPDPALGEFGAGLDLSRRARLAGHRVVVVPAAVVRHAQARYQGLRGRTGPEEDLDGDGEVDAADPGRSFSERRRSVVHGRLVAAPAPLFPVVVLVAVVATLARAAGELAVKQPALAAAEVRGAFAALSRPAALLRARRRAAATRRLPRRTLWALQASWREVWAQAQDRRLARAEARKVQRAPSELEIGELAALATRRRVTLGALVAVLAAASAVAFGRLLVPVVGAGARLAGGALAYASSSLSELWSAATSGWVRDGLGVAGPADPLLTVLAVPAAVLGGHLAAVVDVLLLGSVVLAGVGAWAAAGAATRSAGARAWAAVTWAAAPALLLAVGSGRLGAVLAHATLPWVALGVARAIGVQRVDQVLSAVATAAVGASGDVGAGRRPVGGSAAAVPAGATAASATTAGTTTAGLLPTQRPATTPPEGVAAAASPEVAPAAPAPAVLVGAPDPTGSISAAAGAALALAVAVAGAPVLVVPAVLALVVCTVAAPRKRWRLLLVPVPSLVLLAPLLAEAASRGVDGLRLLVAEPGLPVAADPAVPWQRLLGLPTDGRALVPAGLPGPLATAWPLALGAAVLALALLALLRGGRAARAVRVAWLVAALGLATASGVALVPVTAAGGAVGTAWIGAPLSLALLGLLAAALIGTERLRTRLARWAFGWRQLSAALVGFVAVVVTVGSLAAWVWTAPGASALRASSRLVVPAVAQQGQLGPDASRVLALAADGPGVAWTLLHDDGTQLADSSSAAATRALTGDLRTPQVTTEPDEATGALDALAALLGAGAGSDVSGRLASFAVGYVLVPPAAGADAAGADAAARAQLVGRLDATAGLERVTSNETGTLWRVRAPGDGAQVVTAWARLLPAGSDAADAAGAASAADTAGAAGAADVAASAAGAVAVASDGRDVATTVDPGDAGRVLVLAERADAGWHATLDGRPLRAVTADWRQAFEVGASGGDLRVWYAAPQRTGWLWLLGGVGAVTLLLALPLRRRRAGRS
jgi:GT2 family glycosyltransferase